LAPGATRQLSAVTKDAQGNTLSGRALIWTSDNQAVATVSATGLVSAISAGTATISATSEGKTGGSAATVQATVHSGFYVASNGSSSGSGSMTAPWDLQTALNHPAAVHPGDTIWVRGGT